MSKLQDEKFPQGNIPTGVCLSLSRQKKRKKRRAKVAASFLPAKKFQTLRNVFSLAKNSSVPPLVSVSSIVCRVLAARVSLLFSSGQFSSEQTASFITFSRYVAAHRTLERRLAIVLSVSATGRDEVFSFKSLLVTATIEFHWIMSFFLLFRRRISRCQLAVVQTRQ